MRRLRPHLSAALLLTAVVAVGYANNLGNGFTYDDEGVVVNNDAIKSLKSIPRLFSKTYFSAFDQLTYRPLVTLTYFLDYTLWGLTPFGFHLTNLLLHLLTTLLVYALFARLLPWPRRGEGKGGGEGPGWGAGPSWPALLGAALFAVHPVLTEAVDSIGFREDPLAAGLALLALVSLLEEHTGWHLAPGLMAYGLACLAKETAATLPALLLLCDWARGRLRQDGWRQRLPCYRGVALVTAGYLILRFGIMYNPVEGAMPWQPLKFRLLFWPSVIWHDLLLLVLPVNLSASYAFPPPPILLPNVTDPIVVFPLAVLAALLSALIWLWLHGQRLACLGLLWVVVALLPASNLIPGAAVIAERHLYLAAVGWALLLTLALTRLHRPALRLGLAGALLLAYGTLTIQRNPVWRDNFSLWADAVEKTPESLWAHHNLGVAYEKRGDLAHALREYIWAASFSSESGYLFPYHSAGRAALKQGRLNLAAWEFQQVLRSDPRNPIVLTHLAVVYQRQGRPEAAIPLYRAVLRQNPEHAEGWANLGNLYAEAGRVEDAIAAYHEALRLNPRLAGAHEILAALYTRVGRHEEARAELEAAARRRSSITHR